MLPSDNFISLINIKKEIPDTDDGCDDIIGSSTLANHQTDSLMNIKFESASVKTLNDNGDKIFSGLSFPETFPSDDFVSSINIKKDISDTDDGCDDLTNSITLANNQIDYSMNIKFESANIPSLISNGNKIYSENCFSESSNKKDSTKINFNQLAIPIIKHESIDIKNENLDISNSMTFDFETSLTSIKDESFGKQANFDLCLLNNHSSESQKHHCNICGKGFLSQQILRQHCKEIHEKMKSHICQTCNKVFPRKRTLIQHERFAHLGICDWKCTCCEKLFFHKANLIRHERSVHLKIREWKCTECEKYFIDKNYLKKHERAVHLKIQDWKCTICKETFNFKEQLKRHNIRVHLFLRNLECFHCGKSFDNKYNLKRHERTMHLKIQK